MKNLLEIFSVNYSICQIEIHRRLSARGKYRAAPEVSGTRATYACPQVTYIFLRFPQPSRRNLFEFLKTGDGLHCASCVRLGQAGAISALGKSQRGWAWRLGLLLSCARKLCSVQEGAVPAPGATIASQGAPTVRQGPAHLPAPGSCSAETDGSPSIPAASAASAAKGNSCWFCKKKKRKHARVRSVAGWLSF